MNPWRTIQKTSCARHPAVWGKSMEATILSSRILCYHQAPSADVAIQMKCKHLPGSIQCSQHFPFFSRGVSGPRPLFSSPVSIPSHAYRPGVSGQTTSLASVNKALKYHTDTGYKSTATHKSMFDLVYLFKRHSQLEKKENFSPFIIELVFLLLSLCRGIPIPFDSKWVLLLYVYLCIQISKSVHPFLFIYRVRYIYFFHLRMYASIYVYIHV